MIRDVMFALARPSTSGARLAEPRSLSAPLVAPRPSGNALQGRAGRSFLGRGQEGLRGPKDLDARASRASGVACTAKKDRRINLTDPKKHSTSAVSTSAGVAVRELFDDVVDEGAVGMTGTGALEAYGDEGGRAALDCDSPSYIHFLQGKRTLVLDVSHRPIDVVGWQRAICLDIYGKADVLEYYEDAAVRTPSDMLFVPAVVRVRFYVKGGQGGVGLSRRNIMIRDKFSCQYCGSNKDQTIDHVVPLSKGGEWSWENLVTACGSCNSRKGNTLLQHSGMKLRSGMPKAPSFSSLAYSLAYSHQNLRVSPPTEWVHYLPQQKSRD